MAKGLRDGWADLFLVDQAANTKTSAQLTELMKSVSGKGEAASQKMATTFRTLSDLADWSAPASAPETPSIAEIPPSTNGSPPVEAPIRNIHTADLNLHHDVHIHLPSTSDLSVYTAIFRALKAELLG